MSSIPPDPKGVLFVVSTSHMDWHWISTFEQYYTMGVADSHYAVKYIFDQLKSLLPPISASSPPLIPNSFFRYNLAEVAWLRRYLLDNPDWAKDLAQMEQCFSIIGGGITSPDSLVNNGEVFIRNFLIGREFVQQKGLGNLLSNNCWVPDDFGSDPQLPVVLKAMAFKGVSFARIPGWQPGGGYQTASLDQNQSYQLAKNGVTFQWQAADGSSVLAYYMVYQPQNPAYGVPWQQQGATADDLSNFITANQYPNSGESTESSPGFLVNQPGQIMMTPSGGDFSVPCLDLLQAVQQYNADYYPSSGTNYNGSGVYALMASFGEFVDFVLDEISKNTLSIQTLQGWNTASGGFDPTSYWTGHFANYVQLKISQQRAVNRLLAAETLSTLLRAYSYLSDYLLDGLNNMILSAWNDLVPSTHHDYVNGTAPTSIYEQEQLPLMEQALLQAETALQQGMYLLASSVKASPNSDEIPYVVFNPTGTTRTISRIVEIPFDSKLNGKSSYYIEGKSSALYPIQQTSEGSLLIMISNLESTAYTVVYFTDQAPNQVITPVVQPASDSSAFYMSNGVVQIAIDKGLSNGWALNSILILADQSEMTQGLCNEILAYSEGTDGNPYQMGNEINSVGFTLATSPYYSCISGSIIEQGPYRWRFLGTANNTPTNGAGESQLQVEYTLESKDPLIRIKVEGNAAANTATSVISSWNLKNAPVDSPAMSYGTANHWNGPEFIPYWSGPVFRSTHDFITLTNPSEPSSDPFCAIYHEGMRAWAFSAGQLMGILLRNTNSNSGRGAQNEDTATHVQHYAFRVSGVRTPESCMPLQESMQFQMPLQAAPLPKKLAGIAVMNPSGYLASVVGPAIIRMARTQVGSGVNATDQNDCQILPIPFSFVLRLYQPTNTNSGTWSIQIPFLQNNAGGDPDIYPVSALEERYSDAPNLDSTDGVINLSTMETLTTIRIQSWGEKISS